MDEGAMMKTLVKQEPKKYANVINEPFPDYVDSNGYPLTVDGRLNGYALVEDVPYDDTIPSDYDIEVVVEEGEVVHKGTFNETRYKERVEPEEPVSTETDFVDVTYE